MGLLQYFRRLYEELPKSKFPLSCLARVIYKCHLNSWNTKYSHNVTCICKNVVLPYLFQKNKNKTTTTTTNKQKQKTGMTLLLAASNVRDSLYNTVVVTSVVKVIAHSPVGKLV